MDTFRLVTILPSGRAKVLLDLNSELGGIRRERDSFKFTPPGRRERTASSDRVHQGPKIAGYAHDAAGLAVTLHVAGAGDHRTAARRVEALLELGDRLAAGERRFIQWAPAGVGRSVFYPVIGPATVSPAPRSQPWAQRAYVDVDVAWPVAPLAEGHPMTVRERWEPTGDKDGGIRNEAPNPAPLFDITGWGNFHGNGGAGGAIAPTRIATGGNGDDAYTTWTANTNGTTIHGYPLGGAPGIPVTPGERLYVAFDTYLGINWTAGHTYRLDVIFYDAAGAFVSEPTAFAAAAGQVTNWPRRGGFVDVPAGAAYGVPFVLISGPAANLEVALSRAIFAKVPAGTAVAPTIGTTSTPSHVDGDQPYGRWIGKPYASPSVELVEDKLAEWTFVTGARSDVIVRSGANNDDGIEPARALTLNGAGTANVVMRHTGRGYPLRDFAVTIPITFESLPTASTASVGAGKRLPNGDVIYARFDVNNATQALYLIRVTNAGAETVWATVVPARPVVGRTYYVRLIVEGRRARAEWWTRPPSLTLDSPAIPASSSGWLNTLSADEGPGEAIIRINGATGAAIRVLGVDVEPYAFADVGGLRENPIRGVPGNAPARADVNLHSVGHRHWGLLSAWPAPRPTSMLWNGSGDDSIFGWFATDLGALLASGGTYARTAAGGPRDEDGYITITAAGGAVANQGQAFRTAGKIRRGRTYVLEGHAWEASGAWEIAVRLPNKSVYLGAGFTAIDTVGAGWTPFRLELLATEDGNLVEVVARQPAAVNGSVLRLSGLRLYELNTAKEPPSSQQQERGRGANPLLGIHYTEENDKNTNNDQITDADSPTGRGHRVGNSNIEPTFHADADAVDFADVDDDELLVEAWVIGKVINPAGVGVLTMSLQTSVRLLDSPTTGDSPLNTLEGERTITGAGTVLPSPGVTVISAFRLGTLAIPRVTDAARVKLYTRIALSGVTSSDLFRFYAVVVIPVRRRASNPTGRYNNAFLIPGNTEGAIKTIRSDLTGVVELGPSEASGFAPGRRRVASPGLSGDSLELAPGDNELLTWVQNTFPDYSAYSGAPDAGLKILETSTLGVQVDVTPRYRLWRPE